MKYLSLKITPMIILKKDLFCKNIVELIMQDITLLDPNTKVTTNKNEIKDWINRHGGRPAVFDDPGATGDLIGIRIDFPGKKDERFMREAVKTEGVTWNKFFEIFNKRQLAFVYNTSNEPDDLTLAYKFIPRKNI